MRIVGITGGFGAGKSYVASLFRRLGASVIDADKLGHLALKRGSSAYKRIIAAFGKKILGQDLSINRKALGNIVFGDRKSLAKLNRIVHPGVIKEIAGRIARCREDEVLILDAPLIFEVNITGLMQVLIVVKASRGNQIARSRKKCGMSEKDVCRRMACQMSVDKKIRLADHVIDNDGTKENTKRQVLDIWKQLKREA